ncbi:MAG: hypothetical protein ABWY51_10935 [Gaiellaceae bacterium]
MPTYIWVIFLIMGGGGIWIAAAKDRSLLLGAALGCCLGLIGWAILALLPRGRAA